MKKIASGQALEEYKAQLAAQYQTNPMFLMSKMTDEEKKVWQSLSPYGAQDKIDELEKQIKTIEDALKNPQTPVGATATDHSALMENAKRFSDSREADRYHTANNFDIKIEIFVQERRKIHIVPVKLRTLQADLKRR